MQVENYTQDLSDYNQFRNNGRGGCGIKQVGGSISRRAYERIIREAKRDYLAGFGIDWSGYGDPIVVFHNMLTCQVEWTHKVSGNQIYLTDIHFDKRTGRIEQAGSNCGSLVF